MRTFVTATFVALLMVVLAGPAQAQPVRFDITRTDARNDVKIVHSGFAGNKDVDIRRAYYQYYQYGGGRYDFLVELKLRNDRPDLDTAQLYTTEFLVDGSRYRVYGTDEEAGSLYLFNGQAWERYEPCDVRVDTDPVGYMYADSNFVMEVQGCWPQKRIKVLSTRAENYYSRSMTHLAAWDRFAVNTVIGKPTHR